MSDKSPHRPLNSNQIKVCEVCRLQPMPESTQYLPFLIAQILFLFLNIKISIILLCIGYFFAKAIWICPMCKREVLIQSQSNASTNDHIIIRLNDCMVLVSKSKFRILAAAIIALMIYFQLTEPEVKPKIQVEKSWKSIASNSGFQMYLQNSFKANYFYEKYQDSGNWELYAIFLSRDNPGIKGHVTIKVKMNPSQFSDPQAEDFHILALKPQIQLQRGDQIKITGRWGRRKGHIMLFEADKVEKTENKVDLTKVSLLGKGYLREGVGY